jgi:hypothetical protein
MEECTFKWLKNGKNYCPYETKQFFLIIQMDTIVVLK